MELPLVLFGCGCFPKIPRSVYEHKQNMVGDLNIDILNNLIHQYNFTNLISTPTRFIATSHTHKLPC